METVSVPRSDAASESLGRVGLVSSPRAWCDWISNIVRNLYAQRQQRSPTSRPIYCIRNLVCKTHRILASTLASHCESEAWKKQCQCSCVQTKTLVQLTCQHEQSSFTPLFLSCPRRAHVQKRGHWFYLFPTTRMSNSHKRTSMPNLHEHTNQLTRLLAFTFAEAGTEKHADDHQRRQSNLRWRFKRYGQHFDANVVDQFVNRASQESMSDGKSTARTEKRRPSLKDMILTRSRSITQLAHISRFKEHLSSISSSGGSEEKVPSPDFSNTNPREDSITELKREGLVRKLIGPSPVNKLQKRGRFRKLTSPVADRPSRMPPVLPPIQRLSVLRASRLFPHCQQLEL